MHWSVPLEHAAHDPSEAPDLLTLVGGRTHGLHLGTIQQWHRLVITDDRHVEVCIEEVPLVLEPRVHGLDRDIGLGRHGIDRRGAVPALSEESAGRFHDARPSSSSLTGPAIAGGLTLAMPPV